jgi:hypothetical protein
MSIRTNYLDAVDGEPFGAMPENQAVMFEQILREFIVELEKKTDKTILPLFNFKLHPILQLLNLQIIVYRTLSELDTAEAIKIWANLDKQLSDFDAAIKNNF